MGFCWGLLGGGGGAWADTRSGIITKARSIAVHKAINKCLFFIMVGFLSSKYSSIRLQLLVDRSMYQTESLLLMTDHYFIKVNFLVKILFDPFAP